MTQGVTGSFAINGIGIQTPTEHDWTEHTLLGNSGNGNPTYPKLRQYEMKFNLMSMSDFNQIYLAYEACSVTGSCVVDLPKHHATPYQFYSYTGCVLEEPVAGIFFQEYVQDVMLKVIKVRA